MYSAKVDIDELLEKVKAIKEDDFSAVILNLTDDGYLQQVEVCACGIESDEPVSYGKIDCLDDDDI